MTDQLFNEENTLQPIPYMVWENVGDKVTGIYVAKLFNNIPDDWDKIKEEYVLELSDGTYKKVGGRALPKDKKDGTDYRVIFGMEHVQLGEVMGFKFTEERENKGKQPTKIIIPIYPNDRRKDMEAVTRYTSKYGSSDFVPSTTADFAEENLADEVEI